MYVATGDVVMMVMPFSMMAISWKYMATFRIPNLPIKQSLSRPMIGQRINKDRNSISPAEPFNKSELSVISDSVKKEIQHKQIEGSSLRDLWKSIDIVHGRAFPPLKTAVLNQRLTFTMYHSLNKWPIERMNEKIAMQSHTQYLVFTTNCSFKVWQTVYVPAERMWQSHVNHLKEASFTQFMHLTHICRHLVL